MVTTATTADKLPGGTWGWGPISLTWDLNAQGGVDVDVSILGIDIDTLSGSLNADGASLSDTLDILGIVQGVLGLKLVRGQGPAQDGLWVSGHFTAGPFNPPPFNIRVVSF